MGWVKVGASINPYIPEASRSFQLGFPWLCLQEQNSKVPPLPRCPSISEQTGKCCLWVFVTLFHLRKTFLTISPILDWKIQIQGVHHPCLYSLILALSGSVTLDLLLSLSKSQLLTHTKIEPLSSSWVVVGIRYTPLCRLNEYPAFSSFTVLRFQPCKQGDCFLQVSDPMSPSPCSLPGPPSKPLLSSPAAGTAHFHPCFIVFTIL